MSDPIFPASLPALRLFICSTLLVARSAFPCAGLISRSLITSLMLGLGPVTLSSPLSLGFGVQPRVLSGHAGIWPTLSGVFCILPLSLALPLPGVFL